MSTLLSIHPRKNEILLSVKITQDDTGAILKIRVTFSIKRKYGRDKKETRTIFSKQRGWAVSFKNKEVPGCFLVPKSLPGHVSVIRKA